MTPVGVAGSTNTLTKEQQQFNKLISQIEATRKDLAIWREFVPQFQQRVAGEAEPLAARMRVRRIEMVKLLDQSLDRKGLTKHQRLKIVDILHDEIGHLLADGNDDAELVRLHDKHSEMSYADTQRENMELTQALAQDVFGVDLDAGGGSDDPQEMFRRLGEKLFGAEQEPTPTPERARKKSAKTLAREALREQTALGATKAVREIYRKLASELHPDRESDAAERARKTQLMQQVNKAYEARDLLALLELQLRIEQIDPAALANTARERLVHYNHVLTEQLQRLREELSEITAPFVQTLSMAGRYVRQLRPETVMRSLESEIAELNASLSAIETDLDGFRDIDTLKRWLRDYQIGANAAHDFDMLASMLFGDVPRRRR